MKPKHTSRNVQASGSKPKSPGDNLNFGKMPRLRDKDGQPIRRSLGFRWSWLGSAKGRKSKRRSNRTSRPDDFDRSTEGRRPEKRRFILLIRSLALVVATSLVLGGFIFVWIRSKMTHQVIESPAQAIENTRNDQKYASPTQAEAFSLVKWALETRSPEKVLDCIRPGTHSPEEVVSYLKASGSRDGKLGEFEWLSSMNTSESQIEGVLVHYEKDKVSNNRIAMLVPDDSGVWKFDFDSFARSCAPSWDDLISGRADEAEVRAILSQDLYFNGPFTDESTWIAFALNSHDLKQVLPEDHPMLHAYCKKGSPQAKALGRIFADRLPMNRVIIKIRRVEKANSSQFEISRVMAQEWVANAQPLDEKP